MLEIVLTSSMLMDQQIALELDTGLTGEQLEDLMFLERDLPAEEDFIWHDRRTCNCTLTYVHKKRHAALGVGIEINLCCLAKKVEELADLPPGTFFWAMDFRPSWEWDCDKEWETNKRQPDGSVITTKGSLGPPPKWLLKRFKQRGIKVHNLPDKLKE